MIAEGVNILFANSSDAFFVLAEDKNEYLHFAHKKHYFKQESLWLPKGMYMCLCVMQVCYEYTFLWVHCMYLCMSVLYMYCVVCVVHGCYVYVL